MSEIILNSTYAPGIATYGAQGKQGNNGLPGYALYYLHQDINLVSRDDNNYYNYICNCIRNNIFITNNSNISAELLSMKNRTYQIGDMFLTPSGNIYILKNFDGDGNVEFDLHGELIKHEDLFDVDDNTNLIYNKNARNVLLTDNTDNISLDDNDSSLSVLNIYTTDSNNGAISFISKNNTVTFKQIENGDLMLDSSGNTLFNNIYVDYSNDAPDRIETNYYKIRTFSDLNVTDFYEVKDGTLYINSANLGADIDYCEVLTINNDNEIDRKYIVKNENGNSPDEFPLSGYKSIEILVPTVDYVTKTIKIKID